MELELVIDTIRNDIKRTIEMHILIFDISFQEKRMFNEHVPFSMNVEWARPFFLRMLNEHDPLFYECLISTPFFI